MRAGKREQGNESGQHRDHAPRRRGGGAGNPQSFSRFTDLSRDSKDASIPRAVHVGTISTETNSRWAAPRVRPIGTRPRVLARGKQIAGAGCSFGPSMRMRLSAALPWLWRALQTNDDVDVVA